MEIKQLQYLIAIKEHGNITKAAKALEISQPALSRAMQSLEESLDLVLFERTKNKVELNDEGMMVVEYAKNIIKEVGKLYSGIEEYKKNKGNLSIASCSFAPLWGLLEAFQHATCPILLNENTNDLIELFDNNEYSLLVLDFPMDKADVSYIPFIQEQLYIAVKKDDPLASYEELTFDMINGYNVLALNHIGYWKDVIDYGLPDSLILYQELDAYQALEEITDLPVFRTNITVQGQNSSDRIYIPIVDPEATLHYYIHYHKRDHQYDDLEKQIQNIPWKEFNYNEI